MSGEMKVTTVRIEKDAFMELKVYAFRKNQTISKSLSDAIHALLTNQGETKASAASRLNARRKASRG